MDNQIIYQKQQDLQEPMSFITRLCSCLYFFRKKNTVMNNDKYQLGIDTPKAHVLNHLFESNSRKICVLDLDETLVHSQFKGDNGFDFTLDILVQNQLFKVFVTIRPGAEQFIETISEYFEIILWTASLKEYADPVMDKIDPQRKAQTRLYRESCTPIKGGLTKNLNRLGRDLKDVFIIDNSQMSFILQPENGFLIKEFTDDKTDSELDNMIPFLNWLSQQSDVRPVSELYKSYNDSNSTLKKNGKKYSILSQSVVLNQNQKIERNAPRMHTTNHCDIEEIELREAVGINSPHIEENVQDQDQTDYEERETFEISNS